MTVPNVLTLSRIFLAILLLPFLFWDFVWAKLIALLIFITASLTDLFDGHIARRYHASSAFGAIMDPIADKVLILVTFFAFVGLGLIPLWVVLVIFFREVIVTLSRLWVIRKGLVIPAAMAGKQKTVSQIVAILYILLYLSAKSLGLHYFSYWPDGLQDFFVKSSFFLVLLAMIFTLISGVSYLRDLLARLNK